MNVTTNKLFTKIGILTIENDLLRERITELEDEGQRLHAENERLNAYIADDTSEEN